MTSHITLGDLRRMLVVGLYAGAYHFAYLEYIHPTFEYAHYRANSREFWLWMMVYSMAIIPSLFQRGGEKAVDAGVSIIYLILYVPALITMALMWEQGIGSLILVTSLMLCGQLIIQSVTNKRAIPSGTLTEPSGELLSARAHYALVLLSLVSAVVFVLGNWSHMRLVGFEDVYDLRFASRDSTSAIAGYLGMWLLGVSVPYTLALAYLRRSAFWGVIGLGLATLIYAGNGAKSALLMPLFAAAGAFAVTPKGNSTFRLAVVLGVLTVALALADEDTFRWAKSLLFARLLSAGGWTITTYYEFFSEYGFTFYSHIRVMGLLFGRVHDLESGQLIGFHYAGSTDANFNANFWASDGLAAIGAPGILIASILVLVVLHLLGRVAEGKDQRAVSMLLTGFWLSVLNVSIFTSVLSGGGLIIGLLLRLEGASRHRSA